MQMLQRFFEVRPGRLVAHQEEARTLVFPRGRLPEVLQNGVYH